MAKENIGGLVKRILQILRATIIPGNFSYCINFHPYYRKTKPFYSLKSFLSLKNFSPPLIRLVDTTNIQINNVILRNSPSWTLHLANTTDVHVNNISILASLDRRHSDGWFLAVNTDGFDIDCSKNVLIENCYYSAGKKSCIC
jgi:polygalacturonase